MEESASSSTDQSPVSRDWTRGSIFRNLVSLAWPMMVTEAAYIVTTFDMVWVGRLGSASIAGVGVAFISVMVVMSALVGLIVGSRAMIARFTGAGDTASANLVLRQAFIIHFTFGLLMTLLGFFMAEPILRLFGVEADVVTQGAAYLRLYSLSWIPMSLWFMMLYSMQASGDTINPMKVEIYVRFVHLVIAPFLILGWWVFPRMGVSGAALSNVIADSLGMIFGLWLLFTGRTRLRLTLRNFRVDLNMMWRIVKIAIPACVMSVQSSLGSLVLMWFIAPFGTLAVAAHTLAQRIHMILFLPNFGLSVGAGVLVGQNLGAGHPERAERSGWLAVGLAEAVMVIGSVVILIWAESIISLFNAEPGLVEMGSTFLRIAAAGFLLLGFSAVLQQAISGAGDTLPPMLVSLIAMWVVQIPLAFLLPKMTNLGVYGIRWAMVASIAVGAIAYIIYFRMGRWKHKKV